MAFRTRTLVLKKRSVVRIRHKIRTFDFKVLATEESTNSTSEERMFKPRKTKKQVQFAGLA